MTMNTMELDGYTAVIRYNPETDEFRGEVQGINGGADFYGKTPDELRQEFRASLDFFLEACARHGIEPKKHASGKFVVRLAPDLHAKAATAATAAGISLNALVERAIRHELQAA
jgi:predicted HicB family RNase H-like nuclease